MADVRNRRQATEVEARALSSAIRLRILRLCKDEALTNKEIGVRLQLNPATTLHHVRTLVAAGFLTAREERRGTRGAREVPYQATGKSWVLDIEESDTTNDTQAPATKEKTTARPIQETAGRPSHPFAISHSGYPARKT